MISGSQASSDPEAPGPGSGSTRHTHTYCTCERLRRKSGTGRCRLPGACTDHHKRRKAEIARRPVRAQRTPRAVVRPRGCVGGKLAWDTSVLAAVLTDTCLARDVLCTLYPLLHVGVADWFAVKNVVL